MKRQGIQTIPHFAVVLRWAISNVFQVFYSTILVDGVVHSWAGGHVVLFLINNTQALTVVSGLASRFKSTWTTRQVRECAHYSALERT